MGFTGGDSFLKALEEIEDDTMDTGHILADAMTDRGMKLIKQNTPVETYHLRDSYKRTKIAYVPVAEFGFQVYAWIGRVYTEVAYAPFMEYGTGLWGPRHKKFEIRPKHPGGVLAFKGYERMPNGGVVLDVNHNVSAGGRTVFTRFVLHPGSPGHHMFQIGTKLTEMEMDEWSRFPLELWRDSVEGKLAKA